MRQLVELLLALSLFGHVGAAWAEPALRESGVTRSAYGVGSVLGTVLYTPLKGLLCVVGGTASGFAFLSSGAEAARTMAVASCKGTWVITPDVLRGKEPLNVVAEVPCCDSP